MHKSYEVYVDELVTHGFVIEANTPEEAIDIGEQYVLDGEEGELSHKELMGSDAIETEEI